MISSSPNLTIQMVWPSGNSYNEEVLISNYYYYFFHIFLLEFSFLNAYLVLMKLLMNFCNFLLQISEIHKEWAVTKVFDHMYEVFSYIYFNFFSILWRENTFFFKNFRRYLNHAWLIIWICFYFLFKEKKNYCNFCFLNKFDVLNVWTIHAFRRWHINNVNDGIHMIV